MRRWRAFPASAERAAVRAVALGSVRWYLRLLPAVQRLLDRKTGRLAPELSALLVAAAHQIEYSRNPAQLTVNAAVNAARTLGHVRAAGLVNALLRRFVRERAALLAAVDADPVTAAAHPAWLAAALRRSWPDQADAIMVANNGHPPMTLRVDLTRITRDDYLLLLSQAGIEARALDWAPAAVELIAPVGVAALPNFAAGWVSVQDAGAQLAAVLLGVKPGNARAGRLRGTGRQDPAYPGAGGCALRAGRRRSGCRPPHAGPRESGALPTQRPAGRRRSCDRSGFGWRRCGAPGAGAVSIGSCWMRPVRPRV